LIEIASGVTLVGEAAYSADGHWLAFSARPRDGSTGPDLYLWAVGKPSAIAVTTDHRTYFSAWLGNQVLASRVDAPATPDASGGPAPTDDATALPQPEEAHPTSFVLDPATLVRTELAHPDLWLPVVDATGHFVAYWSGTLVPTADGLDWQLGTGTLQLSAWSAGPDAKPSAKPKATAKPDATAAPAFGPTGTPVALALGQTAAFKAKFDPTGTRLAVWIGEQIDAEVGRLHLLSIDASTGALVGGPEPLPGAPALRRFSIGVGRLAWVTPDGQDGQESTVQVLGWSSTDFGEIRTVPAKALQIVG
jgi:pyruvate/2-oxoglutarate dehydrogenase complex dihydrolipoamide acyltransferase (E2) component